MQIRILAILVFLSFILLSGCAKNYEPSSAEDLYVIEDFTASGQDDWELFTDQVMGGVSTGDVDFVIDGKKTLHMTGDVSLENNGGFILTRKNLKTNEGYFNASGFDGVWIKAKGNGKNYSVHIRTSANLFPWQFYQADFVAENITKTHFLPFTDFTNYGTKTSMKLTKLKFISIAAAFEEMQADLYVEKIGFYKENAMFNKLTDEEKRVIIDKGTEKPFTGEYFEHYEKGIYVCRRCGAGLYHSTSKFKSNCGWPSYDEAIDGAVTETPDADGRRTEKTCTNCGGHRGHVFRGEGYTDKDTRHCVNSISMEFIPESRIEKAIVASGCFWGVQHQLSKIAGVLDSNAGYTGGDVENPTYKQVCTGTT